MRLLVLGGDGMLGHQLLKSWTGRHEVKVTIRKSLAEVKRHGLFHANNTWDSVDVRDNGRIAEILGTFQPHAVVNAVGIVKQRAAARAPLPSIEINSLTPHRLCNLCRCVGARLVQISTDCVFSGDQGGYTEQDTPDPRDLYGHTKLLGEVTQAPGITLRTSIIGLELFHFSSLIEWYLAARGSVKGFTRAIYSGVTTLELARVVEHTLTAHPDLTGRWHVASEPINKHDLLLRLTELLNRTDIQFTPDHQFACDRSLNGQAFALRTDYSIPSWDLMLAELAQQIQETRAHHVAA